MQFFNDALQFFKSGAESCFGDEKNGLRVLIALAALSVLHLLTVFMPDVIGRITAYLNIAAHVIAIVYFMWLGLTIFQAVLVFMASLFVYTMLNFIPYLVYRASLKKEEGRADK